MVYFLFLHGFLRLEYHVFETCLKKQKFKGHAISFSCFVLIWLIVSFFIMCFILKLSYLIAVLILPLQIVRISNISILSQKRPHQTGWVVS